VADDFGDAHVGYVFGPDDAVEAGGFHLAATEAEGGEVRVAGAQFGDDLGAVVIAAGFAGREEDARVGVDGDGMSLTGWQFCASLMGTITGESKLTCPISLRLVRQAVQDLVAPDLKANTAKLEACRDRARSNTML
jgi:hypothetical protein